MHHIAVCDDEEIWLDSIVKQLEEYLSINVNISAQIHAFSDGYDLLEKTDFVNFDLYILDILMPVIKGIDIGKKLREAQKDGIIVYLTSTKDFALDAYEVQPFHYLLKPVKKEKLFLTLDQVFNVLQKHDNQSILVKTKDGVTQLSFDEIIYIEYVDRICQYHLRDGRSVSMNRQRQSFSELMSPLLKDDRFCRCGASFVINLYYVKAINKDLLYFKENPFPIYIPKRASTPLLSAWLDYWMKGENNHG